TSQTTETSAQPADERLKRISTGKIAEARASWMRDQNAELSAVSAWLPARSIPKLAMTRIPPLAGPRPRSNAAIRTATAYAGHRRKMRRATKFECAYRAPAADGSESTKPDSTKNTMTASKPESRIPTGVRDIQIGM